MLLRVNFFIKSMYMIYSYFSICYDPGVPFYTNKTAYMVIDLKVLVKSFNCEDRSCYAGNPHESFREFAKVKCLFAKVSRKLDIMHQHANRSKGSCKES